MLGLVPGQLISVYVFNYVFKSSFFSNILFYLRTDDGHIHLFVCSNLEMTTPIKTAKKYNR